MKIINEPTSEHEKGITEKYHVRIPSHITKNNGKYMIRITIQGKQEYFGIWEKQEIPIILQFLRETPHPSDYLPRKLHVRGKKYNQVLRKIIQKHNQNRGIKNK